MSSDAVHMHPLFGIPLISNAHFALLCDCTMVKPPAVAKAVGPVTLGPFGGDAKGCGKALAVACWQIVILQDEDSHAEGEGRDCP